MCFPHSSSQLLGLQVMMASFTVFCLIWFGIAKRPTSNRIREKYNLKNAVGDPSNQYDPISGQSHRFFKAELATRVLSTLHAVIVCYGAVHSLLSEPELYADMLWKTSPVCTFYFAVSMAYFIGDIILCVVMFKEYGTLFLIHALCGLFGLTVICFGHKFHFFGCIGLLWEMSTVFLNNRWLMLEYGYKRTTLFVVNSLALVLCFIVVRVVLGCPFSYMFWSQLSAARAEGMVGRWTYLAVTFMLGGFNFLNIFWAYKVWHLSPHCAPDSRFDVWLRCLSLQQLVIGGYRMVVSSNSRQRPEKERPEKES
mmetsp:Transcript_38693/g.60333  ORF Transcript_38693/g.60333 Transcript_38693/m.60333 type:complete len:310 (-) Transcript_38693:1726-2655(-)